MSEARDPATNRINAESGESVKSCAAMATWQAVAHHGVPKEFQGFAICGNCGKEFAPKQGQSGQFCSRACVSPGRSQLDEGKVIDLYESGIGIKTIAAQLIGRASAKSTIRYCLVRNGVELRSTATTQDEATKARRYAHFQKAKQLKQERERLKPKKKRNRAVIDLPLFGYASEQRASASRAEKLSGIVRAGYKSEYHMRYANDPAFRAKEIIKRRFQKLVKGVGHGSARMMKLIGCSPQELRSWIEGQWEEWMTWDNLGPPRLGYWQVDHIIPCSWFDQEDQQDLEVCWHYLNLRPLCAVENNARRDNPSKLLETIEALPAHPIKERMKAIAISR